MPEPVPIIKVSTPSACDAERSLPPVSPALSHLRHLDGQMPLDFVSQVHEAAFSPSPLVGLLQDPYVVRSLTRRGRSRSSRRPSTSATGPERDRREDKENDSMNVLTVVLAEEERQVNHLRGLLRTTADRLEDERVRANQAENRADFNESRVRELQMKLTNSEAAKHSADNETERAKDEAHRLKMQMDMVEREVQRLRNSLASMTKRKDDAEREASEAHDMVRKTEQRLREYEAEQEGRDEGRRLASKKNYDAGWRECWPVAHEEGRTQGYNEGREEGLSKGRAEAKLTCYEEGRKKGKVEGYQEGIERGMREERDRALQEFDRFLEEEVSASVHERHDRVQRWVSSLAQAADRTRERNGRPRGMSASSVHRGDREGRREASLRRHLSPSPGLGLIPDPALMSRSSIRDFRADDVMKSPTLIIHG